MADMLISRREFLHLSLLGSCLGLSGCTINPSRPTLSAYEDLLPKDLLEALPSPWNFRRLKIKSIKDTSYLFELNNKSELLAIGDGWLQDLSIQNFSTFSASEINGFTFSEHANAFLRNLGSEYDKKIWPIGFSPWVMIFRRGEHWLPKAKQTWKVLIDPELKDQLILPSSPRVIMELAKKMGGIEALRALRLNAKTFDDRNALNWLLSGKAKIAVMPLQYCLSSIRKDPRLKIAIPEEGAPLNWTLLLKGSNNVHVFPSFWITKTLKSPLLLRLINNGWIPPVNFSEILDINERHSTIKLPFSKKSFENFWPLTPLDTLSRQGFEEDWLNSIP